ncbi:MAG: PilZ domain-containing protein [Phycisphaerales bacterium]|nr:PilZ domain-containing protein [Phycisphaerales bacterium]
MQRWPQMRPEPMGPDPDQKRRTGRIAPEGFKCDLGKVLDLSAGGIRISGRGPKPGDEGDAIAFKLDWGLGSMVFQGRVMRLERRALFGWVAGVSFENLTPAHKQALSKASMLAASGEITEWHRAG